MLTASTRCCWMVQALRLRTIPFLHGNGLACLQVHPFLYRNGLTCTDSVLAYSRCGWPAYWPMAASHWPAWPMAHPVGKLMEVLCSYLSFISNLCVRLRVIFSRVLSGFWLPSAVCCALPDRWRYWRYNWFLSADWTIQFARSMSQEKMWCMYSSC